MEQRLKEAFDDIQAEDVLKNTTKQAVFQAMREGAKPKRRLRRWAPVTALVVCCLLALGLGGHHLYYTPTTVLSIDINPSVEMDINRFDRVIALNGYNDDGVALAAELNVKNMNYDDAVDALMANDTINDCLARGEELSIAVVQAADGDAAQSDAVLNYVSNCTAEHKNAHCYALESDDSQMADAHDAGLSCGKYHAYQELLAYDPSITPEEVQQMTMREIRELLASYQGDGAAADSGAGSGGYGNGQGAGNGSGNGQSQGAGSGQGQGSGNGQGQGLHAAEHSQGAHHGNGHE
ncbi:MAG: hypothetical protein UDG94_04805 [Peptococcaceae bacterium]|nr:hypothetical protein [Peptococcaceae bacterium]